MRINNWTKFNLVESVEEKDSYLQRLKWRPGQPADSYIHRRHPLAIGTYYPSDEVKQEIEDYFLPILDLFSDLRFSLKVDMVRRLSSGSVYAGQSSEMSSVWHDIYPNLKGHHAQHLLRSQVRGDEVPGIPPPLVGDDLGMNAIGISSFGRQMPISNKEWIQARYNLVIVGDIKDSTFSYNRFLEMLFKCSKRLNNSSRWKIITARGDNPDETEFQPGTTKYVRSKLGDFIAQRKGTLPSGTYFSKQDGWVIKYDEPLELLFNTHFPGQVHAQIDCRCLILDNRPIKIV